MKGARENALNHRRDYLDTIAAVLPIELRDELAELLTDQDVETLRHLVNQGMGENTLRALTSDLAYLEAWSLAAMGNSLPWPAPEALLLKFVAHHLWDPEKRLSDSRHGMPIEVEDKLRTQGFLRSSGPRARYRPPSAGHMVYADQMAGAAGGIFLPSPQISYSAFGASHAAAEEAQECQGGHG